MYEHIDELPVANDPEIYPELTELDGFGLDERDVVTGIKQIKLPGDDKLSFYPTRETRPDFDRVVSHGFGQVRILDGVLLAGGPTYGQCRKPEWDITIDLDLTSLGKKSVDTEMTASELAESQRQQDEETTLSYERAFLANPFELLTPGDIPDYPTPDAVPFVEHTGNKKISAEKYSDRMRNGNMILERSTYEYKNELGIDFKELALKSLLENGEFVWYDLCCGDFNAGRDVSGYTRGLAKCVGVDIHTLLESDVQKINKNCWILRGDVVTFPIPQDATLVTCHKGLRYIDKLYGRDVMLGTIHRWMDELPVGARLVAEVTEEEDYSRGFPTQLVEEFGESALSYRKGGCLILDYTKTQEDTPQ